MSHSPTLVRMPADRRLRGRVIVLAAIVIFSLALRTAVTSITPLLGRISADLGFDHAVSGVVGMLPTLMFGIAGLSAPALGRRFGLENVTLAAVVLTGVGIATRSLAQGTWSLVLLSGVALFGMGIGNILIPPLVKRYFSDRIASISTLYICAVQLGTTVPAAIAVPMADAVGWRWSLGLWALIPAFALLPWLSVARARAVEVAGGEHEPNPPRLPVWRAPMACGRTFMSGMTSLMTYSMFTWLPEVLLDGGGSESLGGLSVAVFSGIGFVGTFVAPTLATRFANPFGFVAFFGACMLSGFAGLLTAPMSAPMLWAVLTGLGATTFPMSLTLINVRTRSSAGSASLSGFAQGVGYLLACAGPLLFGVLHDLTHGWLLPFAMLTCALVAMLVGGWVICRPRYLEDQLSDEASLSR